MLKRSLSQIMNLVWIVKMQKKKEKEVDEEVMTTHRIYSLELKIQFTISFLCTFNSTLQCHNEN